MSKKIAPTLQIQITALTGTTGDRARAELRALLAVARAAQAWRQFEHDKHLDPDVRRLCRALARLDRASQGGK